MWKVESAVVTAATAMEADVKDRKRVYGGFLFTGLASEEIDRK